MQNFKKEETSKGAISEEKQKTGADVFCDVAAYDNSYDVESEMSSFLAFNPDNELSSGSSATSPSRSIYKPGDAAASGSGMCSYSSCPVSPLRMNGSSCIVSLMSLGQDRAEHARTNFVEEALREIKGVLRKNVYKSMVRWIIKFYPKERENLKRELGFSAPVCERLAEVFYNLKSMENRSRKDIAHDYKDTINMFAMYKETLQVFQKALEARHDAHMRGLKVKKMKEHNRGVYEACVKCMLDKTYELLG